MAALAYISDSIPAWDTKRHHDYKIKNFVFTVPADHFLPVEDLELVHWTQGDTVYGIATCPKPIKLSRCAKLMPLATLFRASVKQRSDLTRMAVLAAPVTEKQFTKQCYNDYTAFLKS